MQASYAYHIYMKDIQLSMGISGGFFQYKVMGQELSFIDPGDPLDLHGQNQVIYVPDINLGAYLLNYRYHLGFSINQLTQSYLKLGDVTLENYKLLRHYYIMGGYRIPLGMNYEIEPSILLKGTEKLTFQADATAKIYYKEDYWVGTTIRSNGTMIAIFGVRFTQLYFGYAFDYTLSSIRKHSWGSHEIVIAIKFGDNARRYRWLNRY